ncbi:MAG: hypothetical protein J5I93_00895 [Pirellulaceae bacterium]|nr:hypothetical protein [Pirellulaceae bacterium]
MSFCPQCRRELPGESAAESAGAVIDWAPVARLSHLAEVGFFADGLEAAGIATNVHQQQEFSALDGRWTMQFILRVPRGELQRAAQLLRDEVAASEDPDAASEPHAEFTGAGASRPRSWAPLLLVLVAGSLAYVAGRGGWAQPRQHLAPDPLRRALSESEEPLLGGTGPDGQPGRILRYDANSDSIILADDLDGDGRFERQRRFRLDSLAH